nr:mRNA-decapping enzyme 1B isoform X2 [Vicugna pacos]
MNRLSMENRTEPITKDLDFLLQDPFLLYRNARSSICGIWFYDTEECQRIAELMKNLTQYEQLKAHHGAGAGTPPMTLSSREEKEVDIVRMLARAKDEYTKCKTCSEPEASSPWRSWGRWGASAWTPTCRHRQGTHAGPSPAPPGDPSPNCH